MDPFDLLLAGTYTRMDALRRLRILKQLLESRLFGSISQPTLSPDDSVWISGVDENLFGFFTRENLYKLCDDMEDRIKKIEVLTVYLPFELPERELVNLGEHLRKDYGKNFLIEIKFDPGLIGGCSLVWHSIMKDYSIKKMMEDQQGVILNNLKQMLKQ